MYYRFDVTNRAQYTRLHSWDPSREYRYTDVFPTLCAKSGRLALTDLDFPFGNPTASISVMNVDGTDRQKIFQRQDGASLMPTWSPDCQWIAFGFGTFFGGRGFAPANVFMVKADGSREQAGHPEQGQCGLPRLASGRQDPHLPGLGNGGFSGDPRPARAGPGRPVRSRC